MPNLLTKPAVPEGSQEARDQMIETDWFPIFRSGKYPQCKMTEEDVDEIVEEFQSSGRRPPMTFDHISADDMAPGAKPGPAAGYIVDLRSVDSTDPRYPNTRVMEARAKASWSASYTTQSGMFRNVSAAFYECHSPQDGKKRMALHHLALLGTAPPAVAGLPEVIFSESTSENPLRILHFALGEPSSAPPAAIQSNSKEGDRMETIAFTEHQALLGKQEAEIKLSFSEQIKSFKEQVADLTVKVEEATAKVEAASAEVAKVQAESVVAVEAARAEGVVIGTRDGKAESERVFNEKLERQEIASFCEGLVKSGKISQAELTPEGKHPLADVLFSLPSEHRESMKTLLSNRPALASFGEHKAATLPAGSPPSGGAITDEALMSKASELRASNPSMQFRESITTAKALLEKGE